MRTITAAQQAVLNGGSRGHHVKVEIYDGSAWRDMDSYPGYSSVISAKWESGLDAPITTATVEFIRDLDSLSLNPLVDNAINRNFNPANSVSQLVDLNRLLRISVAVFPADRTPASQDYIMVFSGRIWQVNPSRHTLSVSCRDLGGDLADYFAQVERVYCMAEVSGSPVSVRIFEKNTAYSLNEYVVPTEARRGFFYKVTQAGTTSAEPNWPGSGTVASGSVVFTFMGTTSTANAYAVQSIMRNILNDNGFSSVSLLTPLSPGWNISVFKAERKTIWEMLYSLAQQIGWDIRYKWDAASSDFKLTFSQPDRSKTVSDYTFGPGDYENIEGLTLDKSNIRNSIAIVYQDASDRDPGGSPKRKRIQVKDAASIAKYGELYMEMQEDPANNIDSTSEATAMVNAALADLKEPSVTHEVNLLYAFPWAEIGDLYTWTANGKHYSSNQQLAVVNVYHVASQGDIKTSIQCRGAVAGYFNRWKNISVNHLPEKMHDQSVFFRPLGMTLFQEEVVGGRRFVIDATRESILKHKREQVELHLSSTSGFIPSPSTNVGQIKGSAFEVTGLKPGATYYGSYVPFYDNESKLARGEPSEEFSFVAARASAGHFKTDVLLGKFPLNGNFNSRWRGDASQDDLPDHWTLTAGTLRTHVIPKYDATSGVGNAKSGKYYMLFNVTNATGAIKSSDFIIEGDKRYMLKVSAKNISGTGSWSAKVTWQKYDGTTDSTETVTQSVTADVGSYVDRVFYLPASANARFANVEISTGNNSTQSFAIDSVVIEQVDRPTRYYQGTTQAIATSTNTIINFDSAYDSMTASEVTTGANWKYTAPATGFYLVQAAITMVFDKSDTGTSIVSIYKNGSENRRIQRQSGHTLREETEYMGSAILYLLKGDYIHINYYQTTGYTRSTEANNSYIEIVRVA